MEIKSQIMQWQQLLDEWLSSWTGNNPNELLQYYDTNCVYSDPTGQYSGHKQLINYFRKLLSKNPNWIWRCKPNGLYPHQQDIYNNKTTKWFTFEWIASIPIQTKTGDTKVLTLTGIDLVEFDKKSKLIKTNHVFFNANRDYQQWLKYSLRKSKL